MVWDLRTIRFNNLTHNASPKLKKALADGDVAELNEVLEPLGYAIANTNDVTNGIVDFEVSGFRSLCGVEVIKDSDNVFDAYESILEHSLKNKNAPIV